MIVIEHSVTINRPLAEVYDFVVDIDNAHQWRSGIVEATKTSPEIAVGATAREVLQIMGRRIENTYEVTRYEPNEVFAFKTISGPILMEGTYSFEAVAEGTKVDFEIRGEPTGIFKLAQGLLESAARQQVKADHSALKTLLESRAT